MSLTVKTAKAFASEMGIDSLDADLLLAKSINKDRTFLFTWPEYELSNAEYARFREWLTERENGKPVAYILGYKEFWSLPLKANPTTLIPRPDTEVLVETVLNNHSSAQLCCVDLGTGTGAIALALKSERNNWQVIGVDRIVAAIELAKENAHLLGLDVNFLQGDWCAPLADCTVDIIVSNPPYIDENDLHLQQGDVRFEPSSALIAGDNGLADFKEIVKQAREVFKSEGWLYLEHGWQQASAVQSILLENGFTEVVTVKDYGGNDRVSYGRYSR